MGKLKLDIFSTGTAALASPHVEVIPPPSESLDEEKTDRQHRTEVDSTEGSSHDESKSGKKVAAPRTLPPRFIPVGFYPEDLAVLEETVFRLRRNGHRLASKSGVIRALILRFRNELDMVWLEANRAKKG